MCRLAEHTTPRKNPWAFHLLLGLLLLTLSPSAAVAADRTGVRFQIPEEELDALKKLFEATGGETWTNRAGWLDDNAEEWAGVSIAGHRIAQDPATGDSFVVERGQVVALRLAGNGLRGSLPPELGDLQGLVRLHLQNNEISGTLPASIGQLTALEFLTLGNNQLSGPLPPWLSGMTTLRELGLGVNRFTGMIPDDLNRLQALTALDLSHNELRGPIPVTLTGFPFLINLALNHNFLDGEIPTTLAELSDSPFQGSLDLRENCLGLSNVTVVQAGWAGTFRYDPQRDWTPPDAPDFKCALFEVVPDETGWADPVTVRFQIENGGPGTSEKYRVGFYLSASTEITTDKELIQVIELPPLQAGATTSVQTVELQLPMQIWKAGIVTEPNRFYLGMIIDPYDEFFESDEHNNGGDLDCPGYDTLKIFGPPIIASERFDAHHIDHDGEGFTPCLQEPLVIDWCLVNVGYGDTNAFFIQFLLDDPPIDWVGDRDRGRVEIEGGLRSGEGRSDTYETTVPLPESDVYEPNGNGTYTVKPRLWDGPDSFINRDPRFFGQFGDEVYGDDIAIIDLCPDLRAGSMSIRQFDPSFLPGDCVPYMFEVENRSPVLVDRPVQTAIVLSRDRDLGSPDDVILDIVEARQGIRRHVNHLFLDLGVKLPGPADPIWVPGNNCYYFGMIVDPAMVIEDDTACCDRSNNTGTAVRQLKVNYIPVSVGGGVSGGSGSPSSPLVVAPGIPVVGLDAEAGAQLTFQADELAPRDARLRLEFPSGSGVIYIRLDGTATETEYDRRIEFNDQDRGPFDVPFLSDGGQVSIHLEITEAVTGGTFRVIQDPPPPPPVSTMAPSFPPDEVEQNTFYSLVDASEGVIALSPYMSQNALGGALLAHVFFFQWDGVRWAQSRYSRPLTDPGHCIAGGYFALELSGASMLMDGCVQRNGQFLLNRREGNNWIESSVPLSSPNPSLSGDRVAFGYPNAGDEGEVRILQWDGTRWPYTETIVPKPPGSGITRFGSYLALSEDRLLVAGRIGDSRAARWVCLFYHHRPTGWAPSLVTPPEEEIIFSANSLGQSLSLDGDIAAQGHNGINSLQGIGKVITYHWNGTRWTPLVLEANQNSGAGFGGWVKVSGDRLAVHSRDTLQVFQYRDGSWAETHIFRSASLNDTSQGGRRPPVALDGNLLVISKPTITAYNLALVDSNGGPVSLLHQLAGVAQSDPNVPAPNPLTLHTSDDGVEIVVRRHESASHLEAVLMQSRDLQNWIQYEQQPVLESRDPLTGMERWTVAAPTSSGASHFFRLSVQAQ